MAVSKVVSKEVLDDEVSEEEAEEVAKKVTKDLTEELTAEQQKMNELMRRLIDANTVLVVKVAACDCRKKNSCKVYVQAQEIAKIIDELQDLRPR